MADRNGLETTTAVAPEAPEKKPFVAPTISVPVDVLEGGRFSLGEAVRV